MVSAPEDDFASFLDFGDINFSAFDGIPEPDADLQQQHGAGAMDTSMEGPTGILGLEHGQMLHQIGQHSAAPALSGFQSSSEPFPDLALQSELFEHQQRQQIHMQNQRYHAQHAVPPTPNSLEMHGGHAQYYRAATDHQQIHMYDHYRRSHKDQVSLNAKQARKHRVLIELDR